MKNKPSKAIITYCVLSIICMIFTVTSGWQYIFEKIMEIGVYDQGSLNIISDMFIRLYPPALQNARIIGGLIGGIIRLMIIIGIFRLKNWVRKIELALCSIVFIVLAVILIPLIPKIFMPNLWIGYYLFYALLFLVMLLPLIIIFFFTRPGIRKQFERT